MGIQELQRFIEAHVPNACVPVDLLKIARGVTLRRPRTPSSRYQPPPTVELCLVLDAECCLDRLYGGYFSDWICGGQWNRMVQFLSVLIQTVQANNMELAVYFGGALELNRMHEWVGLQYSQRKDINQALKHVATKSTPPPKVWWTAPSCLRTALRMALRHLKVQVLSSTDDHRQDVISFCRDNNYHGILAEDAEYIMFNPPRYFSAKQMKLTYKGSLETKEFILNEIARGLDLQPNRFCLLAALLGNYLLTDEELSDFHSGLSQRTAGSKSKVSPDDIIRSVVEFVRTLPSIDNLDDVGARVFKSAADPRVQKLKQSVQYFVNGTRDGYFKYKPSTLSQGGGAKSAAFATDADSGEPGQLCRQLSAGDSGAPSLDSVTQQLAQLSTADDGVMPSGTAPGSYNGRMSPANGHTDVRLEGPHVSLDPPPLPSVTPEVIRTASERHQKGLMSPWVFQTLSQGEIKIGVSLEDELSRELPNASLFYRPIREHVYAVLFNLYHHHYLNNKDKEKPAAERHPIPHVQVREWAYSRNNPFNRPDMVTAKPLGWGVPTVQRLWFGTTDDDKKRRLRAFLSCMHSDSPNIRNPVYVPQHLLVMACVLRYIMSQSSISGHAFLCKPELDAFIAQALSPKLTDSHYLQELQLPAVTPRGVQLANLFMQGIETALFANDACGAPVPWLMCCPWLFFDGKLFHSYLLKASQCRNVMELCDNQLEMVAQLDMIRQAVLDGLHVQYARPPLVAALGGSGAADRRLMARGGRLEIGGVVVGSWAGNMGLGRGFPAQQANLLPGGMHRRPAGRGGGGGGGGGSKQKNKQNKKKAQSAQKKGADGGGPIPGLGRGLTVDTSSDHNGVGDGSAGAGGYDGVSGQFEDTPLPVGAQ